MKFRVIIEPDEDGVFMPAAVAASPSPVSMENRSEGVIQSLKEGGFGFITPDEDMENIFFHFSEVKNRNFSELRLGDRVTYVLGRNEKGYCATQILAQGAEQPFFNQPPYDDEPFLAYDED